MMTISGDLLQTYFTEIIITLNMFFDITKTETDLNQR